QQYRDSAESRRKEEGTVPLLDPWNENLFHLRPRSRPPVRGPRESPSTDGGRSEVSRRAPDRERAPEDPFPCAGFWEQDFDDLPVCLAGMVLALAQARMGRALRKEDEPTDERTVFFRPGY